MANPPSEYRSAFEAAKRELADLLEKQQDIGKRIVTVRESIQTLAALCESEQIDIDPSDEADAMLENSSLADEIRNVLQSQYPGWLRPSAVKTQLTRLGHDLNKYRNPQATIHMVLKRMTEAGEVQEWTLEGGNDEGKKAYRKPPLWMKLSDLAGGQIDPNHPFNRLRHKPKRGFGSPPVKRDT